MLKNITLSADEKLLRKARSKAKQEHTTLNSQFRQWLEKYTSIGSNSNDYENLMEQLSYAKPTMQYTRDEMNER
ncbi:MAG: hypothetical protein HOC09_08020 [Deltaproteobacteria bacterium]|jgi:hypothetical protein|nr:hypothetical protein [Deltaproteobacteria bacterium]